MKGEPRTPPGAPKKYAYRVIRLVEEVYLVESDEPLEKAEHIWGLLTHPETSTLEREVIQQVRP